MDASTEPRTLHILEGDTEEAAAPSLFRSATGQSLTAAGITMLNTKGSRSMRRLVEVLTRDWKRAAVVLADADARGDVEPWCAGLGLTEGKSLHFIGTKEFEDAFPDEVWLRALESSFPPGDQSDPWTLDELRQVRERGEKFGDDLVNLVRRRCRDHTIGKPDLGVALPGALKDAKQIPAALRECFEAATRIVTDGDAFPMNPGGAPERSTANLQS